MTLDGVRSLSGEIDGRTTGNRRPCTSQGCPGCVARTPGDHPGTAGEWPRRERLADWAGWRTNEGETA